MAHPYLSCGVGPVLKTPRSRRLGPIERGAVRVSERQDEEIEMTFAEAYDCVRLSFYPVGDAPIDVTVSEISFTKTS